MLLSARQLDLSLGQVRLTQWIAILGTAERFPNLEKLTPDGLTGTGNFLDLVDPNELRPDIIFRTQRRLGGIDASKVRRSGRHEIRSTGE